MNKTININLGGFFFHIDETAYQKLKRYLDAIARSLSDDPQGKNEIIADIEARISELLSERITDARQVVNDSDIDEVIAIMGQPEDYAETDEAYTENTTYNRNRKSSKKLFRDGDDKFLGGVCAGIAHYVAVDAIWIRLAFLLLVFAGFGFGIPAYIILWVLLPEAKTTSEKLQMEGEAVNIENIEKKIRDEIGSISSRLKDGANEITDKLSGADYDKIKSQTKSGFQDLLDTLGKILTVLFKVFGKFLAIIFLLVSGIMLVTTVLGVFSVGSFEIISVDSDWFQYPPFFQESILPIWLLTVFFIIVIGLPFLALFILGLRILSPNVKRLNSTASYTLVGLWIVALLGLMFFGIEFATSKAYDGVKVTKNTITINNEEPVKIAFENNNDLYYLPNIKRQNNSMEVFIDDEKFKYSNYIKFTVKKSENENSYVEIIKESEARKKQLAIQEAEKINYNYTIKNNKIVLDAFFLSAYKNLLKDEEVSIVLYLPEDSKVFFENSSKKFLYNIANTDNIYDRDMANHTFQMTKDGLDCIDCSSDSKLNSYDENTDNNWNDNDNNNDVTFLFSSTINNEKAELLINKNTTKKELEKLASWFKNKKNIDIDFSESTFNNNGTIETYFLKVNCNDGFSGTTNKAITINSGEHGFVRNYDQNGSVSFKIW
ncbi:PspC domain-containing protein [Tenacibaculum geojense]|uniref:PspC domain-containing protein n=1 Tax=Tenacibaculum geojense TaxID=915352 RepID=A0ABW3JS12_9FLAO